MTDDAFIPGILPDVRFTLVDTAWQVNLNGSAASVLELNYNWNLNFENCLSDTDTCMEDGFTLHVNLMVCRQYNKYMYF